VKFDPCVVSGVVSSIFAVIDFAAGALDFT
jgi:hypothetical protein